MGLAKLARDQVPKLLRAFSDGNQRNGTITLATDPRRDLLCFAANLISRRDYVTDFVRQDRMLRTIPLRNQLHVLAIEQPDIELGEYLSHHPELPILASDQRLPHGRHLDVQVVIGQKEIRREAPDRPTIAGGDEGKRRGFV
jgi:hypothetical protein